MLQVGGGSKKSPKTVSHTLSIAPNRLFSCCDRSLLSLLAAVNTRKNYVHFRLFIGMPGRSMKTKLDNQRAGQKCQSYVVNTGKTGNRNL